jgi:hypothetical protein
MKGVTVKTVEGMKGWMLVSELPDRLEASDGNVKVSIKKEDLSSLDAKG